MSHVHGLQYRWLAPLSLLLLPSLALPPPLSPSPPPTRLLQLLLLLLLLFACLC